jgi:ribosomal protein S18 acetylase RimI-like enzyme
LLDIHAVTAAFVSVRRATPADAPAIASLYEELHAAQWTGDEPIPGVSPDGWLDEVRAALAAYGTQLLVATSASKEVIGSVRVEFGERPYGRIAEIRRLIVTDPCRRRGVGAMLMAAAEDAARDGGAMDIRLTVIAENDPARRLYERLGYELFAIRYRRPLR